MNTLWSSSLQLAEKNTSTLMEIKGIGEFDRHFLHLALANTQNIALQQEPHRMEQRR